MTADSPTPDDTVSVRQKTIQHARRMLDRAERGLVLGTEEGDDGGEALLRELLDRAARDAPPSGERGTTEEREALKWAIDTAESEAIRWRDDGAPASADFCSAVAETLRTLTYRAHPQPSAPTLILRHVALGPCDGFGPNGECSMCTDLVRCADGTFLRSDGVRYVPAPSAPTPTDGPDGEWSREYWQLDQAVLDAEERGRPDVQIATLRAIRDRFKAPTPSAWREDKSVRALIREFGATEQRCREAILRRDEAEGITTGEAADRLFTQVLDAVAACSTTPKNTTTPETPHA